MRKFGPVTLQLNRMHMYEQHFGLDRRPFRSEATGKAVFVGPSVVAAMAGIKKALAARDAIISVSGVAGSGKTTLIAHALGSISGNPIIVRVARMRLQSEDVLELLLDELGVTEKPRSTIQRFAMLRRKLKELEENQTRVFVIIEDSVRLGADTLSEIETLTSADAGPSEGASLILMGDESLNELLEESQLARVKQRIRHRFTVAPLSATELHGYLRHCFRLAGGQFGAIFEENAAALLHDLTGGVPRTCNNLIDSVLTAAADQNQTQVSSQLLSEIAEGDFGLSVSATSVSAPVEPPPQQEPETRLEAEPAPQPEPVLAPEPSPEPADDVEDAPLAVAEEPVAEPEPVPEAPAELQLATESSPDVAPADPDPTVAELKPDLDALEQAMALAKGGSLDEVEGNDAPMEEPQPEPEAAEVIPEITLDDSIQDRIQQEQANLTSGARPLATADSPNDADNLQAEETAQAKAQAQAQDAKAKAELAQIAAELSKAKTIEDIDDKMAETLFGEEFNSIAAQFAVHPPTGEQPTESSAEPVNEPDSASAPGDDLVLELVSEPEDNSVDPTPAAAPQSAQPVQSVKAEASKTVLTGNKSMTSSQRLRTVRALNADATPTASRPTAAPEAPSSMSDSPDKPVSIEDQFATSISSTQTQRVLKVVPPEDNDDDDDNENKGGFFSRFKRS